jgi:hypothetical protein
MPDVYIFALVSHLFFLATAAALWMCWFAEDRTFRRFRLPYISLCAAWVATGLRSFDKIEALEHVPALLATVPLSVLVALAAGLFIGALEILTFFRAVLIPKDERQNQS